MSSESVCAVPDNETNVTLLFEQQDDTLGNLLRHQLLLDPEIIFAAYKVPHPLTRSVEIRAQTLGTPVKESVDTALGMLVTDLDAFDKAFNDALSR